MNDYDDSPTNVQGTPPPPGRPLDQDQKSAIAAALVGTAALGGAAWGMSRYYLEDDTSAQTNTNPDDSNQSKPDQSDALASDTTLIPPVELDQSTDQQAANGTMVSTLNRDDMTFDDAFREARSEMGAGNYFDWHGQLYNTFYQDEWERMSHGAQQEFLASVYGDDMPEGNSGGMLAGGEIPSGNHTQVPDAIDNVPINDPEPAIIIEDDSVHAVADVAIDDSNNDPLHAQDVDIAIVDFKGHEVAVFDTDNDDRPDAVMFTDSNVVLLDTDDDHVLDTRAIYDADIHKLVDMQSLNDQIKLDGSMDVLHKSEHLADPMLADKTDFDTDLGIDFDSNTDIGDYV